MTSSSGTSSSQGPKGDGTMHAFLRPLGSSSSISSSSSRSGGGGGGGGGAATTTATTTATTSSRSGGGGGGEEEEEDMDTPVANKCFTKRQIKKHNDKDKERVPKGCKEVVEWGNTFVELQSFGSLVVARDVEEKGKKRKQDGSVEENTAFFFRCNVSYECNNTVALIKLGDTFEGMKSSNGWRHLRDEHSLYSSRGATRVDNKAEFQEKVVVAAASHLRRADPHRYFGLEITHTLHIKKLAPFAWANDADWRLLIKGLQEHAVEAARTGGATFNVEAYHDKTIRVRIGFGTCLCVCYLG